MPVPSISYPPGTRDEPHAPHGDDASLIVNDVHSQLNRTHVYGVIKATSLAGLRAALERARDTRRSVSIAGGRHSMGGQQFGAGTLLIDTTCLNRVLAFDADQGRITVEAGIQWPELVQYLLSTQAHLPSQWGIRQKQTGADRLSLGGALAANVHGRGLRMPPIVADVESFVLVGPDGEPRTCSRVENRDLFRLVLGGYGLFGVIYAVQLQLTERQKVERRVEMQCVEGLMEAVDRRIAEEFQYGDFQFAIDPSTDDFLSRGIFCCYRPVPIDTPVPATPRVLSQQDWTRLAYLAHEDKRAAFAMYAAHYLATDRQIYWSDTHQLSEYVDDYHRALDYATRSAHKATEMITEVCVPRSALPAFLADVRADFRQHAVNLIYGTIRFIERDSESFLAWAREPWACVVFNLHTVHTPAGLHESASAFRRLIDLGIRYGGSYYLPYHRWARPDQVEACYPQFRRFLALKREHDRDELFQSDWYRHYRQIFG